MGPRLDAVGRCIYWYRDQLLTIFIALIFLPLPLLVPTDEAWVGYLLLLMAAYWCCLCVPMWATGLIPLFTLPLMGIMSASEVAQQYMKDYILTFAGAVMAAYAIENVSLHHRCALFAMNKISLRPEWLIWGLVLPTFILSIFIMNAPVLAMMFSVMESLLKKMQELLGKHKANAALMGSDDDADRAGEESTDAHPVSSVDMVMAVYKQDETITDTENKSHGRSYELDEDTAADHKDTDTERVEEETPEEIKSLGISVGLAMLYGAKMGGMSALTGDATNLVAKDFIDIYYADFGMPSPITYTNWMALCLPIGVISVILTNTWVQLQHVGWRSFANCCKKGKENKMEKETKESIKKEYEALGSMKFDEAVVAIYYTLLVLLWFFREPGFMPGWGDLFPEGFVTDCAPAMLITFLMLITPRKPLWKVGEKGRTKPKTILEWGFINTKFPWGIFFMVGGGAAVGEACKVSGLTEWIASILGWLADIPPVLLVWFVTFTVGVLTEFLRNITVYSMFTYALGDVAVNMGYNPLYLQLPCTLGASLTFMVPSSAAASALAYSYGRIPMTHMMTTGFMVKIWVSLVITLGICTWGELIFDLHNVPPEMMVNHTIKSSTTSTSVMTPFWLAA